MSHFNQQPEFEKEFKRLAKKYRSLPQDLKDLEEVLETLPTGIGKNFSILHYSEKVKIVKTRLACKSLHDRSVRIIYAYHNNTITFVYIEIYYKGDKENEDKERIEEYLKTIAKARENGYIKRKVIYKNMFSFTLPNGKKIDTDGVMDAMEGVTGRIRYFLDTVSGEVGCVSAADKGAVVKFSDDRRYVAIPPVPSMIQSRWLKEFMEMIIKTGTQAERTLYKKLANILKIRDQRTFDQCLKTMGRFDESLLAGWASWQGDHLFEEIKTWFATLPVAVDSEFDADCDCELCKLIVKGSHTIGDFNEASQKQTRKKKIK